MELHSWPVLRPPEYNVPSSVQGPSHSNVLQVQIRTMVRRTMDRFQERLTPGLRRLKGLYLGSVDPLINHLQTTAADSIQVTYGVILCHFDLGQLWTLHTAWSDTHRSYTM